MEWMRKMEARIKRIIINKRTHYRVSAPETIRMLLHMKKLHHYHFMTDETYFIGESWQNVKEVIDIAMMTM